ncbi:MAG: hypothetical protein E7324_08595 [Clostridiales bacterium]|nr:hypothetical protein [Clostridiales bacterium]
MKRILIAILCLCLLALPALGDGVLDDLTYFGTPGPDMPIGFYRQGNGKFVIGYNACVAGWKGKLAFFDAETGERREMDLPAPLRALCSWGQDGALILQGDENESLLYLLKAESNDVQYLCPIPLIAASAAAFSENHLLIGGSMLRVEGDSCAAGVIYSKYGVELRQFVRDLTSSSGVNAVMVTDGGLAMAGWTETDGITKGLVMRYTGSIVEDGETTRAEYRLAKESVYQRPQGDAAFLGLTDYQGGLLAVGSFSQEGKAAVADANALAVCFDRDGNERWANIWGNAADHFLTAVQLLPGTDVWVAAGQSGVIPEEQNDVTGPRSILILPGNGMGRGTENDIWQISLNLNSALCAMLLSDDEVWVLGEAEFSDTWRAEEKGGGGQGDIFIARLSKILMNRFYGMSN